MAVLAENSLQAIYAELSVLKPGASVVSLSGSVSLDDLGIMLRDAEPPALLASQEHFAKVEALRPRLSGLVQTVLSPWTSRPHLAQPR